MDRIIEITNEMFLRCTDISQRGYWKKEGRELPEDAENSVKDLEELTRLVSELYGINGAGDSAEKRTRS